METKPKKLAEFWAECERIQAERDVLHKAVKDAEEVLEQARAALAARRDSGLLWAWYELRQAGYEP